jgi:hypothetical protein
MSDPTEVVVAGRDDALRDDLIDQLSADRFHAEPARGVAEVRCRAARDSDLLLLGEVEDRLALVRLLRAIRSGDALPGRIDPALPVIVLSGEEGRLGGRARLRGGLRRLHAQARALPRAVRPRAGGAAPLLAGSR